MGDTTDATVSPSDVVNASMRLAGGLAVERSAVVKGGLKVLDAADGKESGAGALYVRGGAHIGGETFIGKTLDIESNTVVGGKLSVFYGLAVLRPSQFGGGVLGASFPPLFPFPPFFLHHRKLVGAMSAAEATRARRSSVHTTRMMVEYPALLPHQQRSTPHEKNECVLTWSSEVSE